MLLINVMLIKNKLITNAFYMIELLDWKNILSLKASRNISNYQYAIIK
jgi:hypothetical protein